jgi:predicted Zn-dependent peptidase
MKQFVFPSGLKFIFIKNNNIESTSIVLSCKVGSINESKEYISASHLVEHMLFKGTVRHPTSETISKIFDDVGAYSNAYTSTNITAYVVKCHSDDFNKCISILFDMICCSTFVNIELNKEKDVVVEEILENSDDIQIKCLQQLNEMLFNGTDYARTVAGSEKDIKKISRDSLFKYYKTYYRPDNMVLSIHTNLSYNTIVSYLKKIKYVMTKLPNVSPLYSPLLKVIKTNKNVLVKKIPDIEQTYLSIGFYFPFGFKDIKSRYILSILERYLGGTMSSVIYIALREQAGIGYSVWSDIDLKPEHSALIIYASFEHSKLHKTTDIIKNRLHILHRQGMTKKELIKQVQAYIKSMNIKMESPMFLADYYANYGLYDIIDQPNKPPRISTADVNNFINKYLDPDNALMSIVTKT